MRLESLDGTFVELAVAGYEFGSGRSDADGPNWDANWLIVHGKVWDGQQSWEFRDPCMTTWEARELAGWLKGLGNASIEAVESATQDDLRLWFTEPNLMFALEAVRQGVAEFSVHFDAEARPPAAADDGDLGHRVPMRIPLAVITTAVDAWEEALADFPVR